MSPRAACRLEALGFEEIYDYATGKVDCWRTTCRSRARIRSRRQPGGWARDDVVRCALDDRVGEVREQIAGSSYGFALVVAPGGVLLGRLRGSALDCDPALAAEEVMEAGPTTVRPHTAAGELSKRLAERNLRWALVTDPEGRLIGVASREDLARA